MRSTHIFSTLTVQQVDIGFIGKCGPVSNKFNLYTEDNDRTDANERAEREGGINRVIDLAET